MTQTIRQYHEQNGAKLAPDGIPLHYENIEAEYNAALNYAALFDRSHEGRLSITGKDRFDFLNRMSTNNMLNMAEGEGRATIFTNTNARIMQRIMAYHLSDSLEILTEPGQGIALENLLKKQIFFNDKVTVENTTSTTHQFSLHGPAATNIMADLDIQLSELSSRQVKIGDYDVIVGQNKPLHESHWFIITSLEAAQPVYQLIEEAGINHGLKPAGSLTYNALRIRSGRPAGRELSTDYIPLEVGLWDEISFNKGCYTGQEIIARMESRAQLAKVLVHLDLDSFVEAPAKIEADGRVIGTLTSSFVAPDQSIVALGVVKPDFAASGQQVTINQHIATIRDFAGKQPDYLKDKLVAK